MRRSSTGARPREDGYSQIYTFQYLYTYGGDVFGDPVAIRKRLDAAR